MVKRPAPSGEYAVGTFTHTIRTDIDEVFAPGTKRSVPVRVYYPVKKGSVEGMTRSRYMSRDMADALKKTMHAPVNYDKGEAAGENVSDCYENAPKIEGAKFPLIMFSHGHGSYREANSFLCLDLVSHGYVVISVGHPYDAALTESDDGTKTALYKDAVKKEYEPFIPGAFNMLKLTGAKGTDRELADRFDEIQNKYCKYIISRVDMYEKDTVCAVEYAKENLSDMIDFTNGIGAAGHSLGGAAAYMLCLDNEEFSCGINMDGALFGNNKGKILRKPFVQLSSKSNITAETRAFIDHTKTVYSVVIEKLPHIAYSDMKHMIPSKAIVGKLEADLAHEVMCRTHLELFDSYLKKTKDHPEIKGCEHVTVTEYQPDIKE